MAAYAAAVDEVDQSVGRMLDYLQEAGMEQNTLVIFLSDNGGDYSNGSITTDENQIPWEPRHESLVQQRLGFGEVHAVSILQTLMSRRWHRDANGDSLAGRRKRTARARLSMPASITDIYPTLIELAGIEYPAEFEGTAKTPANGTILTATLSQ